MVGGQEVAKSLRGERKGGIPWMTILDADRKELVTSDGPKGNIGCPVTEDECAWFLKMLETTRQSVTDAEMKTLAERLEAHALRYRRK